MRCSTAVTTCASPGAGRPCRGGAVGRGRRTRRRRRRGRARGRGGAVTAVAGAPRQGEREAHPESDRGEQRRGAWCRASFRPRVRRQVSTRPRAADGSVVDPLGARSAPRVQRAGRGPRRATRPRRAQRRTGFRPSAVDPKVWNARRVRRATEAAPDNGLGGPPRRSAHDRQGRARRGRAASRGRRRRAPRGRRGAPRPRTAVQVSRHITVADPKSGGAVRARTTSARSTAPCRARPTGGGGPGLPDSRTARPVTATDAAVSRAGAQTRRSTGRRDRVGIEPRDERPRGAVVPTSRGRRDAAHRFVQHGRAAARATSTLSSVLPLSTTRTSCTGCVCAASASRQRARCSASSSTGTTTETCGTCRSCRRRAGQAVGLPLLPVHDGRPSRSVDGPAAQTVEDEAQAPRPTSRSTRRVLRTTCAAADVTP